MRKLIPPLIACFWMASALAADLPAPADAGTAAPATSGDPDSGQMQRDLQQLDWKQFRSVIESVPKMKADVDAFGPLGWQYVQANYSTYPWKKSIDRLDAAQKKQLAELIQTARSVK